MNSEFIIKFLGLPVDHSAHGAQIDTVIFLVHALMFVLFIGWAFYFVAVLIKFRKNRNQTANYQGVTNHFSSYLEIVIIIAEAILLVGFSIPFWSRVVNTLPDEKDAVVIRVVAEQYAWNIHYPGADNIFGKTDSTFINQQSNPIGLDKNDPHSKDDIVAINQLHLPVNRPVIIYLTSKDVIHSFYLPVMRIRQDVIPGMRMPVWFTPVRVGKSEIACAQLCGLGHYRMRGYLTVETQKEFDEWLKSQAESSVSSESDDFWN